MGTRIKASTIVGLALSISFAGAALADTGQLVKYTITDDTSVESSLTGKPGDPVNGRKVAIHRKKGNCLTCHVMPVPEKDFYGNIGPELTNVGSNLTEGELRLRLINSKIANEDTIMPSFYRNENFNRVLKKFKGKTILSAQEIEDVVAYLMTLK